MVRGGSGAASGPALGIQNISTADGGLAGTSQGAQLVLADDNGSNNNLGRFL
ncbi:hypothetical protein AB0H88_10725 [Nonomuraea sp. NPDC050680]|uniref:hypothetical protein n=1 Tax=Nonomuraea sp. NPDC050680 TaxID=3154630 RepID=UPI003411A05E